MYNYLVERMYQEYETVTDQNNIHFVSNGKVVGTLYRKEQVLNIFLSASAGGVWNHYGLALFVVAKKYAVLNNSKVKQLGLLVAVEHNCSIHLITLCI